MAVKIFQYVLIVFSFCSKSVVHSGPKAGPRRVLESINDQENLQTNLFESSQLDSRSHDEPVAPAKPIIMGNTSAKSTASTKPASGKTSGKRPLEPSSSQTAGKPNKKAKSDKPKGNKKKIIPLQKGQKQLTAFFRV